MPKMGEGHPYRRTHGPSFQVEVALRGEPDAEHGWVSDFGEVTRALQDVRETLDHSLLNEIEGLEKPTLETLCMWIAGQLRPRLPMLARVTVSRPSVGEACTYDVGR